MYSEDFETNGKLKQYHLSYKIMAAARPDKNISKFANHQRNERKAFQCT